MTNLDKNTFQEVLLWGKDNTTIMIVKHIYPTDLFIDWSQLGIRKFNQTRTESSLSLSELPSLTRSQSEQNHEGGKQCHKKTKSE